MDTLKRFIIKYVWREVRRHATIRAQSKESALRLFRRAVPRCIIESCYERRSRPQPAQTVENEHNLLTTPDRSV